MRKQHLKKVNVLGIDVCDIRPERAVSLSLEAMRTHEFDTVFFLSAIGSLFCQNNAWASELVNSLPLVLPGDQHTQQAVLGQAQEGDNGQGKYIDEYMKRFLTRMNREFREIFAVTSQEGRLEDLRAYLSEEYPNITFEGMVYDGNSESDADKVVNEINAHIPDSVLLLLPAGDQMTFLREYSPMMNTRLCVCIESLHTFIVKENYQIPGWVQMLHLDGLFQWFNREEKLKRSIAGSIFKKKVNEDASSDAEHDEQI